MAHTLQIDCWTFQQAQFLQQALIEIGVASNLEDHPIGADDSPNVHLWVHLSTLDSLSKIKEIATQHAMTTIVDHQQQTQHVFMTLTNNELPAGQDITERRWLQPDVGTRFLRICIETRDGEHEYSDTCVAICPANVQPKISLTGLPILGEMTSIILQSIAIAIGLRVAASPSALRALRSFHNPTTTF